MTIPEELLSLRGEMRELRQRVARGERSNEQLRARNDILEKKNAFLHSEFGRLTKENEELKKRLDDTTDHKNTLAGMIFKPNTKERPPSDRPIGGQMGHAAHHRAPAKIDKEVRVHLSHCPKCEQPLARSESTYTRIVEDIALVSPVIVTEYTIEKQRCISCGARVSAIPTETLSFSRFGGNLMTRILTLRYESRLPLNRIALLLLSAHGLSIRESAMQDMLDRTKRFFGSRYEALIDEIRASPCKHADETSWRTKGENGWAWLFATEKAALYTIEETRGKGVPETVLNGSPPESILTVDDYGAYKNLPIKRQSCWAHLLRVAREGESAEARDFYGRLSKMFHELSDIADESFVLKRRKQHHACYARRIESIMHEQFSERDTKKVQVRIRNQGNHLIEALLHRGAHLTNNHAERQIRPLAVFRKITGGSRSRKGAETTARNMTIMQTLKLEGKNVAAGLRELLSVQNQRFVREG